MRLLTFNVQGGRDPDALAAALRGLPADILLLQEIRSYAAEGTSRAGRLARALDMTHVYAPARWMADGSSQGLAVLSRWPLRDVDAMTLPPLTSVPRTALGVTVDCPGGPLRVYDVHLDNTVNPGRRFAQLDPVAERARRAPCPAVVGGDFNTNRFFWLLQRLPLPGGDQAGKLDRRMRALGFDAPTAASGPTVRVPLVRLRLDGFYTRGLDAVACGVERTVLVSDHWPLWMDVRFSAEPALVPAGSS